MKKLIFTLALITSLSFAGIAQEKESGKRNATEKLSAEQRNALHLKEMTLDLDLTASQQKEIAPIIAEQTTKMEAKRNEMKAKKEAKKSLTANEKFEMKNKSLDNQIEMKAKMKKILNAEQMEKWEANKGKRKDQMNKIKRQHRNKTKGEVSK
jgi:protein CpxP